jgi:DNA-binding response OmpR family regulator
LDSLNPGWIKILIVEDDSKTARAIRRCLEAEG